MKLPLPLDIKKYSKLKVTDITMIALLSAILLVVQVALSFLPNIQLVSILILLYTLVFGWKSLYMIYIFVFLEGLIYGFGIWWANYLYVWLVLFIIAMIFRKNTSKVFWSIVLGIYGLSFGALCSIPYFIVGGFEMGFSYWIAGIPFDLIHGFANLVIGFILFKPLYRVINMVNTHCPSQYNQS